MKSSSGSQHSVIKRSAPVLAFIMALSMLLLFCHALGYTSLPPTEKRYVSAKARIASLKDDTKRNTQREPWEKLALEFKSIYDSDPAWPNRPAALFRSAESLEELAKRSCSKADAKKAINYYETVALRHANSRLADDALFRAAKLRAASLRDEAGALALLARLKKQYPKGDMLQEATALERALQASARGQAAPEAIKSTKHKDSIDETPPARSRREKLNNGADLPLKHKAALSQMEKLKTDKIRSCWRQPWENLEDEFLKIANASKGQLGQSASFQAALCQEKIAACSKVNKDSKKALEMHQANLKRFPEGKFAEATLLQIAKLQKDQNNDVKKAEQTLKKLLKSYPKGQHASEAKHLLSLWENSNEKALQQASRSIAGKNSVKNERPELQVLSWDSPNRNRVDIVLEMSGPVKYKARLAEKTKGSPARLFVELDNATVVNDVRKGVSVQGSLLQAVRVKEASKNGYTLQFDFRDAKKFETHIEENPSRIMVSVVAGAASLPSKSNRTLSATNSINSNGQAEIRHVSNMASQLGLTVHKVFIDAGHGGKDPGTSHNNILERAISLDIALRLGQFLKANGLEVAYSRESDKGVPLSQRTRLANAVKADLFVSIHVNAHDNSSVEGIETYYLNLASNKQAARVAMLENSGSDKHLSDMRGMLADVMLNARVDESHRLANDIQKSTIFRLKKTEYAPKDNGVKSAPFHVLLGAQMPAVLVEVGYCTNPREARNLGTQKYRNALASGLAEGILTYKNRLLHNHTAHETHTNKKKMRTSSSAGL